MDRLSTSAREWTPGGASNATNKGNDWYASGNGSGGDSDLNPAAVKEFVPGKGWSVTTSSAPQHQGEFK